MDLVAEIVAGVTIGGAIGYGTLWQAVRILRGQKNDLENQLAISREREHEYEVNCATYRIWLKKYRGTLGPRTVLPPPLD